MRQYEFSESTDKIDDNESAAAENLFNKLKLDIVNMHKKMYRSKCEKINYMNYAKICQNYRELLGTVYNTINNQPSRHGKHRASWHASILYRLIAHTRDIVDGRGERELAYIQLFEWARVDAPLAKYALESFVNKNNKNNNNDAATPPPLPLGSWKDVKSFAAYMRRVINVRDDRDMQAYMEMTDFMVGMVNARLAADVLAFYSDDDGNDYDDYSSISYVSKWIPRENKSKKYGNLYERLACDYYKMWLPEKSTNDTASYDKAVLKCKIHYRKLIAFFNRHLETPQIKMCERDWATINFDRMTRQTQDLQANALLNVNVRADKQDKQDKQDKDRETCADRYKTWKCELLNHKRGISAKLESHVSDASYRLYSLESNKNAEWGAYVTQLETGGETNLKYMIPLLAGSSVRAIGLALAVAEKSIIGKQLITATAATAATAATRANSLYTYKLEDSFVKNVNKLKTDKQNKNLALDIYSCLNAALQTIIASGITPIQFKALPPLTLAVFADREADFNIGGCETCDCMCKFNSAYNEAARVYAEFGYAAPKIFLWVLESSSFQELPYYSSSEILSRRTGCGETDIVRFLGIKEHKDSQKQRYKQCEKQQEQQEQQSVWVEEWNALIHRLYNINNYDRYAHFETYFWKYI